MSKERVAVKDSIGIVLEKADGTVITNEPKPLTEDILKEVSERYRNGLDERGEDKEFSQAM